MSRAKRGERALQPRGSVREDGADSAAHGLVARVRKHQTPGRRGTYTRLAFRLLEEGGALVAPIAARMGLDASTAEEILIDVVELDRLEEALDLVGERT